MASSKQKKIEFKCLKLHQPIGELYIGVIDHEDLIEISYADIRRLETGTEQREVEIFSGIQRTLSKNRVKTIGEYVNMCDATFPTSIILHINPKDVDYDEAESVMRLPKKKNIAKILDGQHRIAGLEHFNNGEPFQLNVIVFVGMELEDQALVFATINITQTKVNKSLVADLFEFASHRSPQKTAHNIIRALNEKKDSPFKDKIKILGTAIDKEKETITQSTFADCLIRNFSKNSAADRDIYKRGKKPEKFHGRDLIARPLRNLFVDKEDGKIAKIIWNYFDAIQKKWPNAWKPVKEEMILNKSTGFIALMRFFKDAYISFERIGEVIEAKEYLEIFNQMTLKEKDFNRTKYLPGSGGQSNLYKDFIKQSGLKDRRTI